MAVVCPRRGQRAQKVSLHVIFHERRLRSKHLGRAHVGCRLEPFHSVGSPGSFPTSRPPEHGWRTATPHCFNGSNRQLECRLKVFQPMGLLHSREDLFLESPIRVSLKADEIRYDLRPVPDPHLRSNHVCSMQNALGDQTISEVPDVTPLPLYRRK